MKILLIKPPLTLPKDFKGIARFFPAIGLGYIAASIEKNGYDVKILDAGIEKWNKINEREDTIKYLGMSWKDITRKIKQENPDIVGISVLTVEAVNASFIAKAVKNANKNIKVVVGGPHVCVRPKQTISDPNIDFIVIGEGEITTVELIKALDKNKTLKNIKGIWYKENGKIIKNEPRPLIQNLDMLPFPSWHLMNMEKYFKATKYFQGSRSIPERGFSMITSRGCPFACVFCSIRLSMGRKFRARSPKNVVDEIEQLVKRYDVRYIGFEDDNLTFDRKRIKKICDLIIKKGLNKKIIWGTPNGVRADTLDENLLKKMKEAGCREITVSPESGSQWVVNKIIGKNLDLKTVEDAVIFCKKIGIECGCFFVIGLPGETIEQIEETVKFANKMRALGATPFCSIAWPYYGTKLYEISKEKRYLLKHEGKELELGLLNLEALIKTPEFSPKQLYKYQKMIQGNTELNELFGLIKTRPLDALRCFTLHPIFITKYLLKNYVLRMKK